MQTCFRQISDDKITDLCLSVGIEIEPEPNAGSRDQTRGQPIHIS